MEINGGHPNEKKNIQSLPRKGFGHHRLHLVDIQRQAEEWDDFTVKEGRRQTRAD